MTLSFNSQLKVCQRIALATSLAIILSVEVLFAFQSNPKRGPNIIIIYADDLGWTDLGVQGSDFYETPHLDELAAEGIRFINAYANSANCAPSRASLMTGLYPPRHGIYTVGNPARGRSQDRRLIPSENRTVLDPSLPNMPYTLRNLGYTTCIAGKWHLSEDPLPYGFDQNFGGTKWGHPKSYFSPYQNDYLKDGPEGEHLPMRLASEVSEWITEKKDSTFFVYLPFYSVHLPIQAREDLVEKYRQKAPGKFHHHIEYAAMVEAMDEAIGNVLKTLDELNLEQETLVIFTSDNGQHGRVSIARPLRGAKGMFYEGGIRVPLIVRWPGKIKQGSVNDELVIGTDIFPTILDIVEAEDEFSLDGVSLFPLLQGERWDSPRTLFWHFPAYLERYRQSRNMDDSHDSPHWRSTPCSVVRHGNWKLIEYFESGDLELFDLVSDIGEKNNLAGDYPEITKDLHSKLEVWRVQTHALVPTVLNPEFKD